MVTLHRERLAGSAKRTLGVLVALTLCLGVLVPSALAVPTGEYANFKDCPLSVSGVVTCVYSTTTGGEVKLGNTTVPIAKPIVFQGGLKQSGETTPFVPAADGVSLTKVAQTVPGGLLNIVCRRFCSCFSMKPSTMDRLVSRRRPNLSLRRSTTSSIFSLEKDPRSCCR